MNVNISENVRKRVTATCFQSPAGQGASIVIETYRYNCSIKRPSQRLYRDYTNRPISSLTDCTFRKGAKNSQQHVTLHFSTRLFVINFSITFYMT